MAVDGTVLYLKFCAGNSKKIKLPSIRGDIVLEILTVFFLFIDDLNVKMHKIYQK